MEINAEFDKRVIVHSEEMEWAASPMPGVDRRPLDRVGGEVARATSIVRYAPGSHFSPHIHTGGEEFIVLDGVFQDEHGDFPAGSYVRNPPMSKHKPGSDEGCIIFVKLWQFTPDDRTHVRLDMNHMHAVLHQGNEGVSITPLYADEIEQVELQIWQADTLVEFTSMNGVEILVLDGGFQVQNDTMKKHCWLRIPMGETLQARAGAEGAKIWVKHGNLHMVDEQIKRVQQAT